MRKLLVAAWLLVLPVLGWVDHRYGPLLRVHETAAAYGDTAESLLRKQDWSGAVDNDVKMLGTLPDDPAHRAVRVQLELAMDTAGAKMGHQLESINRLDDVLERLDGDPSVAPAVLHDVRRELGTIAYYNAWLMRLQNAPTSLWTAEAERARQQFRYLALADGNPSTAAADSLNVERVIRLEQLDLSILRARKLPKEASGLDPQPTDKNVSDQAKKAAPKAAKIKAKVPDSQLGRPGGPGSNYSRGLRGS